VITRTSRPAERDEAAAPTDTSIVFDGVTKHFGRGNPADTEVLHDVDLTVARGEFVALIGPSGCGKSTLLNLLAGIVGPPDQGEVRHEGRVVSGPNRDIGYVTQANTLLPWRTALENVELGLRFRGADAKNAREAARRILDEFGLGSYENHYPAHLSGGMRSRVQIARTLALHPTTIVMDEPFGALDALLRRKMQDMLADLRRRIDATVLYVTHEIDEALALADRIVVFSRRPARIMEIHDVPRVAVDGRSVEEQTLRIHEQIWQTLQGELDERA